MFSAPTAGQRPHQQLGAQLHGRTSGLAAGLRALLGAAAAGAEPASRSTSSALVLQDGRGWGASSSVSAQASTRCYTHAGAWPGPSAAPFGADTLLLAHRLQVPVRELLELGRRANHCGRLAARPLNNTKGSRREDAKRAKKTF